MGAQHKGCALTVPDTLLLRALLQKSILTKTGFQKMAENSDSRKAKIPIFRFLQQSRKKHQTKAAPYILALNGGGLRRIV
jgi:hypothetical protein